MDGGIGVLILLFVALAAAVSVMRVTLNARWKSTGELLREARQNVVGASILLLLAVAAMAVATFVVTELL